MRQILRSLRNSTDYWTGWVSAGPHRAWLKHLADATGYAPEAIAVAAGVSTAVGRGLAGKGRHSIRIRARDASGLLALDADSLRWRGARLTDASPAHKALRELGDLCPDAAQLSALLGISRHTARGMIDGRLRLCRRWVLWHCIALTQDIMRTRALATPGELVA